MRSIQRLDPTLGWIPPAAGSHSRQLGIVREGLVSSRVQLDANSSEELLDLQTTVGPHHTQPFFGGRLHARLSCSGSCTQPLSCLFRQVVHTPCRTLTFPPAASLLSLFGSCSHSSPYLAAASLLSLFGSRSHLPYLAAASLLSLFGSCSLSSVSMLAWANGIAYERDPVASHPRHPTTQTHSHLSDAILDPSTHARRPVHPAVERRARGLGSQR
jgi:hypothetical protein